MIFRIMRPEDMPEIMAIEREAYSLPWSEAAYLEDLTHEATVYITAEEEGKVAGYMGGWLIFDEVHITTVAVRADLRRKGVASVMLATYLDHILNYGTRFATLEVRISNVPAIGLYRKLGFKAVGVREHYYCDNDEAAVIMWTSDMRDGSFVKRLKELSRGAEIEDTRN